MRRPLRVLLLLSAWLLATGSLWDVAQVIAWGRMITGYAQAMSVGAAVEKTFSGEMCDLCRVVQKGKQDQDGDREQKRRQTAAPGATAPDGAGADAGDCAGRLRDR